MAVPLKNAASKKATETILAQKQEDEQKINAAREKRESGETSIFDGFLTKLKNTVVGGAIRQLSDKKSTKEKELIDQSDTEINRLKDQLLAADAREKAFNYEFMEGEKETMELWIEYLEAFLPEETIFFLIDTFETATLYDAMMSFLTGEKDTDLLMMVASYILDDASAIKTVLTIKTIHNEARSNYKKDGKIKNRRKATFSGLEEEWKDIVYPPAPKPAPKTSGSGFSGDSDPNAVPLVMGSQETTQQRKKRLSEFQVVENYDHKYHWDVTESMMRKKKNLELKFAGKEVPFSQISSVGKLYGNINPKTGKPWTLCSRNARLEADRIFHYRFHNGDAFDAMGETPENSGWVGSMYHENYQKFHGRYSQLLSKPKSSRKVEKQIGNHEMLRYWDGNTGPAGAEGANLMDLYITGYSHFGHRAMGFKAGGKRYVLDPYRGNKDGEVISYEEYKKIEEGKGFTISRLNFHKAEKNVVMDDPNA